MNPFTLDPSDWLVFNILKGRDTESVITVSNVGKKNLIFNVKTNSKSQFVVRPTKFCLEPDTSKQITFVIKNGKMDDVDPDNLPRRDKVEFDALFASSILLNEIEKQPEKGRELIRNRFKACENSNKFKSCDFEGDTIEEDSTIDKKIFKQRIPIIYKINGSSHIEEAPAPTFSLQKETNQRKFEFPPIQKNLLIMVALFICWSVFVFFLGTKVG